MGRVKQALLFDPAPACLSHVRPLLFGCRQAFFKGDVMTLEEPPQLAPAAANSPFAQRCEQFHEGGGPFFSQTQYHCRVFLQPGGAPSTRLRRCTAGITPAATI